ncbi:hypothetical protein ACFQ4L_01185 [Lapidilactobacillus mulanensis]|uniref:Uncharacterized protein n=1 Tax=Lapidilactobacillus mulanensis TaxID=2485999 RepID=A0ABW4DMX2_9LACO|nr:hypothetical protein [Lapidilactobacillus mulanensis]
MSRETESDEEIAKRHAVQPAQNDSPSSSGSEVNEPDEDVLISGQYIYPEIIRDFPTMIDYLGRVRLSSTSTYVDLQALAASLQIRINYSSELQKDFALVPQKQVVGRSWRAVAASLIVKDHRVTAQEQAWLVGQGLATYILHIAEYVPDFSENTETMKKWTVDKMAATLLLPDDLVQRTVSLAIDLNQERLDVIEPLNQKTLVKAARLNLSTNLAAQLANVPEWLMRERSNDVFNG